MFSLNCSSPIKYAWLRQTTAAILRNLSYIFDSRLISQKAPWKVAFRMPTVVHIQTNLILRFCQTHFHWKLPSFYFYKGKDNSYARYSREAPIQQNLFSLIWTNHFIHNNKSIWMTITIGAYLDKRFVPFVCYLGIHRIPVRLHLYIHFPNSSPFIYHFQHITLLYVFTLHYLWITS